MTMGRDHDDGLAPPQGLSIGMICVPGGARRRPVVGRSGGTAPGFGSRPVSPLAGPVPPGAAAGGRPRFTDFRPEAAERIRTSCDDVQRPGGTSKKRDRHARMEGDPARERDLRAGTARDADTGACPMLMPRRRSERGDEDASTPSGVGRAVA